MRWWAAVLALGLMVSCTNRDKVPGDIIQPEAMNDLMWDIMTVKEYISDVLPRDTIRNKDLKRERSMLYQQVFDLHKTSREDFLKSLSFYTGRPDKFKVMVDTLAARGNRLRDELYKSR